MQAKECINVTEMTFSAQTIRENEKAEWWQPGSSVLQTQAQRDVAVIWKYAHFKPDDIRQALDNDNCAWSALVSLTAIRRGSSLMHFVCFEPG